MTTPFDMWDRGPFPDNWNEAERHFWSETPGTQKELFQISDDRWERMQDTFEQGWLRTGMTREQHERYRDEFYELDDITASMFDWDAARDYWETISPAS